MRELDDRKFLPHNRRTKGADVDKPAGYIKAKLRRKWRSILRRSIEKLTHKEEE